MISSECFKKYIGAKFVKRLGSYRFQKGTSDQIPTLLLPLSFGVSSVTLLHLLDTRLQEQLGNNSKNVCNVHVLHIDTSAVEGHASPVALLDKVKERFPQYDYTVIRLSDMFDHTNNPFEGLEGNEMVDTSYPYETANTNEKKLEHFFSCLSSTTAKADAVQILRNRLIVYVAKQKGLNNILWGDTATKLAEKTLTETAKGRGSSIPWEVSDGPTPNGLSFYHPLRELLRKELISYAALVTPPLNPLFAAEVRRDTVSTSAKDMSLDQLMHHYFDSLEDKHPNIVANVVRTSSKLRP